MRDRRIVWDTSRGGQQLPKCKTCKKQPCVCRAVEAVVPTEVTAHVSLDTKKRAGKAVTVVGNLPHNPDYFKGLLKRLKARCGSGGSLKDDHLEVQGDHRGTVRSFLEEEGFRVRLR